MDDQERTIKPAARHPRRATEAALAGLEAEIPYPLSRAVADIEAALARQSFHDRIAAKLAQDPAWG